METVDLNHPIGFMADPVAREQVPRMAICGNIVGIIGLILIVVGALLGVNAMNDYSPVSAWARYGKVRAGPLGAVLYCGYLFQALFRSKASAYLRNIMSESDFIAHIEKIQAAEPRLNFSIQNYHFKNVTVITGSKGNKSKHTERKRVNTHRAVMDYDIKGYIDETLSPAQTFAMFHLLHDGSEDVSDIELGQGGNSGKKPSGGLFLLCAMPLQLCAATPEVQARLEQTRATFFEQNTKDSHQDKLTGESLSIMEPPKNVMVILRGGQDASRERPLWMNWYFFALCTVCLVSVPYRLYLFSRCQKTEWTVLKHFSHLPCSEWGPEAPQQSRVRGTDSASRAFRAVPREAATQQ